MIWIVSNCETSSKRENYAKEMMKYIQIDIYDNYGSYFSSYFKNSKPIPCSNDDKFQTCFNQLIDSYRFYLIFENN